LTCVRAKGNAVRNACRLRWEMNIFKRILTGIAEDVVGVSDEDPVLNLCSISGGRKLTPKIQYIQYFFVLFS